MSPTEPWLWIVGIGEDGYDGLNAQAKQSIAAAQLLYGGARHLNFIPFAASQATRIAWPSPMAPAVEEILNKHRGEKQVTVLASGDPMLFGVGVLLTRDLVPTEFRVVPQVSAMSLACARLGWPIAETTLISLVNRPIQQIIRDLYAGRRIVIFSEDGSTPAMVAQFLTKCGYGPSSLHVFENLGGASEHAESGLAANWSSKQCAKLNLVAVQCKADMTAKPMSRVPGLPDNAFTTDGQLTKREVRSVTLASLAPLHDQTLWDVGAGSGSIGIEWMRHDPSCSCIAFEAREERVVRIRKNAARLGVPTLKVVHGTAPAAFEGERPPDAIFLGGGVSNEDVFNACWNTLPSGGRLVANAVTLESEASLAKRHGLHGGDLTRMMVARADLIGGSHVWRPMMPITQWTVIKP